MRTPPHERVSSDISDPAKARSGEPGEALAKAAKAEQSAPQRTCVLTGLVAAQSGLIRLAISPDGDVLPDPLAKAPGRGAWIGVSREELEAAVAKGKLKAALSRSFKQGALNIPTQLPRMIEEGLRKAVLDRLGLEKRSGQLVLGNDRIAQSARMGEIAWLAHASDAADDGCSKLDQAWRVGRDVEGSGERGIRLPLDRAALSVALGRDNVVHLALQRGKAAERVMQPLARLLHFIGETAETNLAETGPNAKRVDRGAVTTN